MRRTSLECVYRLAERDERTVFIGSDLGPGVLDDMRQEIPRRWFMEGVSEQHIIGMAAGLALEGFVPYVNTIATFLTRRCLEQVAMDLCLHNLPVRLIANGGGVVYAPLGPTHLAIEDIALMRALPNMTIVAPSDAPEMERLMHQTIDWPGPIYIRLGKGGDPIVSEERLGFKIGKGVLLREPGDVLLVSTGVMTHRVQQAADVLSEDVIRCGVLHLHTIKPLDEALVTQLAASVKMVVIVEEHVLGGGLGTAVLEVISGKLAGNMPKVHRMGLPDKFPEEYGSQDSMLNSFGLDSGSIVANVIREFQVL